MNLPNTDTYQFIAAIDQAGMRVDKFLSEHLPDISRSRIKSLIDSGNLLANQIIIKDCSHSVKPQVTYKLIIPAPISSDMKPADIKLNIIYEDESLLVINKQAGLTVHPGAGNYQDTMANALLTHCGDKLSGIGGVQRPGIVHRLDKDTSGLIVVAKNDIAHNFLSNQLASRTLSRIYHAIIWGLPNPTRGIISTNIARSNRDRTKMCVVKSGGKEAITHYKLLKQLANGTASLIECKLETGRTHQIRVHLSHIGHSLVGDQTYGNNSRKANKTNLEELVNFKRQALHAAHIGFYHPNGEYLQFSAPMPDDMQELLESIDI